MWAVSAPMGFGPVPLGAVARVTTPRAVNRKGRMTKANDAIHSTNARGGFEQRQMVQVAEGFCRAGPWAGGLVAPTPGAACQQPLHLGDPGTSGLKVAPFQQLPPGRTVARPDEMG